jgi:hypothetical protein
MAFHRLSLQRAGWGEERKRKKSCAKVFWHDQQAVHDEYSPDNHPQRKSAVECEHGQFEMRAGTDIDSLLLRARALETPGVRRLKQINPEYGADAQTEVEHRRQSRNR